MSRFWRKIIDLFTFNFWKEINGDEFPRWAMRITEDFYSKRGVRPYNKIIFIKGKNYIYKVWFEMIGQGQIDWHYYRKLRTF